MTTTRMKPGRAVEVARNEIAREEIEARGTTQQESAAKVEPQKEHEWLQQLVGEWTFEGVATIQPDQPPTRFRGTESVRMLGGLWIVAEGLTSTTDGSPVNLVITLGFDPQRKRFVGTFLDSTMTHLWRYEGGLDETERVLTLNTEGPDMNGQGKMREYKDVIEIMTADQRVWTSSVLGDDGKWREVMKTQYRRRG